MKTKQIQFVFVAFLMATLWQGCKKEVAPDPAPTADFSFTQSSGGIIQFTDKSTSARTYAWDFGNGTTSTEKSPKVVYVNNGDYTVKLSVKNNNTGENSVEKIVTVTTGKSIAAKADFIFTALPNGEVQFTDKSTGATDYTWDFSFGLTSKDKNPKVALVYNGDYKVKLSVSGAIGGVNILEKTVTVTNGKALPQVADEWNSTKGTSGGTLYSFRNHFYTFEVTEDNKTVTANVQSGDIDVAFYWYNSLGQDLNNYGNFSGPDYGRNFTDTQKLNKGKYTLLVTTKNRYAIGKYNLVIRGINAAPVRVASARLFPTSKDFGDGGAGDVYVASPKNKHFTFDVTEDNTYVDIDLSSNSANTFLFLFDKLGKEVASTSNRRQNAIIRVLNKGTYTLFAGTENYNEKTNYTLEINGKVEKLVESTSFSTLKLEGKFSGNKMGTYDDRSFNEYSFEVTQDNTVVDVSAVSTNVRNGFRVYNSTGKQINSAYYANSDFVSYDAFDISKGKYTIRVFAEKNTMNDVSVIVTGMVSNLKKL